jgi:hypothetical protein
MMPHKFNASRCHKFERKRYRVKNWSDYNESLRQRGDVTVWLCPDMVKHGGRVGAQRPAGKLSIQTWPFQRV